MNSKMKQVKTPNGELIAVGCQMYKDYIKRDYVYHGGHLKKGTICPVSGKFVKENTAGYVVVSGTTEYVKENSKRFNVVLQDHFFDKDNRTLTKVTRPLRDNQVADPLTGRAITKGSDRYIKLHGEGYIYKPETNSFFKVRSLTDGEKKQRKCYNPMTGKVVVRFGNVYSALANSMDFQFREEVGLFVPIVDCMLKKSERSSRFKTLEERCEFRAPGEQSTADGFLQHVVPMVQETLLEAFHRIGCFKVSFIVDYSFEKEIFEENEEKDEENVEKNVETSNYIANINKNNIIQILNEHEVATAANETLPSDLRYAVENARVKTSGWSLTRINRLWMNIYKFSPLAGSSYIELTPAIKAKQACVNIQNSDQRCFEYAVLYSLHAEEIGPNPQRVSKYAKYKGELNFEGIQFPVSLKDYKRFEDLNKIKIYVFIQNDELIEPLYTGKNVHGYNKTVDLLLISDKEKSHYVCIKNFNALCYDVSKHREKKFFCKNCLSHFGTEDKLHAHESMSGCYDNKPASITFPIKGRNKMKFTSIRKQLKCPVVIYADIECMLLDSSEPMGEKTTAFQKHVPISAGCYIVSPYPEFDLGYKQWDGKDCVKELVKFLKDIETGVLDIIKDPVKMIMTAEDESNFMEATSCHICKQEFPSEVRNFPSDADAPAIQKVRDHDHFSGEYRGAAHHRCNLQYSLKQLSIPVVFHNFKGYDCHLLLTEACDDTKNLSVIAKNQEQFMTLSMGRLRFIDSFQFLDSSLAELIGNIEEFPHLTKGFPELPDDEDKKALLTRKGVYPYDFVNDDSKFSMTCLPPKTAFHSKLEGTSVSIEEYQHAKTVWSTFGCKTFKDYHDLYLKTDVLLLADVFEDLRRTCHDFYGLDPSHYVSLPGLAMDSALKSYRKTTDKFDETDIFKPIETFREGDMEKLLFVEKGLRGGVSVITHRHAVANNRYMRNYNPKRTSSYIMYFDANNLYGWAMRQRLPVGQYEWISPDKFTREKIMSLGDDDDYGYLFEVDLHYPKNLHDLHNEYPFCPEQMACEPSTFMEGLKQHLNLKPAAVKKLVPNLNDKKFYVLHYRNLKQALKHGLVLEKVHRVLRFRQEALFRDYIDFNTQERAKPGRTDSQKNFFKLMNNAVFGKTCENVRKRRDFRLTSDIRKLKKLQNKFTFKGSIEIGDNLRLAELQKTQILYNRPIIMGMSILDISKTLMYDFHYNVIKRRYGNKAKLLFTDTDSLCYHIETDDVYKDMESDADLYDFSDYSPKHFLFSEVNKKRIGKFKDEANGLPIYEFIGLRAKLYCIVTEKLNKDTEAITVESKKTAKGIKKSCISRDLKARHYRSCLLGGVQKTVSFGLIRSKNHRISSIAVTKSALSSFDDKRWVLDDGVTTLAHGHYGIGK